jgi:vitamin B12 transporter
MKYKISTLLSLAIISPLFSSNIELQPVTITTATKSTQSIQNITSNVSIITADEIQERGYKSVDKALSAISGIHLTRNGGLGANSKIKFRGIGSKRVLVLIDGIRYNNPTSVSGAELSHLMIDNIQQIEIIKGAQSGIWGADASAGVINIITKKVTKNGISGSIFGEYGEFNTLKYGFNSSYKQNKFDISLNTSRLTTDGFSAKVPDNSNVDDFEDDSYENSSADIKVGFNIDKQNRVEAFYNYIDSSLDYDGFNIDPILAANDSLSKEDSKEQFYGVSFNSNQSWGEVKLYAQQSKFERYYPADFTKHFDGEVKEYGAHSVINYRQNGSLTLGIDQKSFKHENSIAQEYNNQGVFLTNSNTLEGLIGGKTIFSQSLRYDKFDDFDNKFTYKIGVKHIHTNIKDFWTSFNYATGYNIPSLYQLYSPYGNQNLNPEETKGFDISANYKNFGITYFQNQIDEMINFYKVTSKYSNIKGKSDFNGVEIEYKNSIDSLALKYNFNYTYLKAEDQKGKQLHHRPKNSANLTLDYYAISNTHIGALIQYVGEKKKSPYDSNPTVDYKAYTLVDFITDYDINDQFNIYLKIDNLLDKDYREVTGYATSKRAFYFGFRYNLK